MSFTVAQCIRELLFEQECVIIPGFGGFITNYKSSEIDHIAHTITPPTKSISFNRQLRKDDGLLVHAYSVLNHVPFKDAQPIVKNWAIEIEQELKEKGKLLFEGIGLFVWNPANSTIQFEAVNTENFLAESYGFPTIKAEPIYRSVQDALQEMVETSPTEEEFTDDLLSEPKLESDGFNFKPLAILALAATLIGFIAMPIFEIQVPALQLNQASVYSLLTENLLPKNTLSLSPKAIQQEQTSFQLSMAEEMKIVSPTFVQEKMTEKNTPVNEITVLSTNKDAYLLVLGVFKEDKNAANIFEQTKQNHPEFTLRLYKKGSLNYVAINAGNTESEATSTLQKAKSANLECWVKKGE